MSGLDSRKITCNNLKKKNPVSLRREIQMYQYYNTNLNNCLLVFFIGSSIEDMYSTMYIMFMEISSIRLI